MKKRASFTIDEDVIEGLKLVPRGVSVSEFVNFMLKGLLAELKGANVAFGTREEYEKWVNSDPELKRIREALREAWGPPVWKVADKLTEVKVNVTGRVKRLKGKKGA